jgi:succinate-semialdehyde dehydrogenase/glutarate-semialdehyde dehydrogenase
MHRSINPYDQSLLEEFPIMDTAALDAKLSKAELAFKSWKRSSFAQRRELMLRVSSLLRKNKDVYARHMTLEMGKVTREALGEIEKTASACEYFAHHAEAFLTAQPIKTEAAKSYVIYQPTGVILAIMPWNFPFWQVFRFAVPALMAGNVGLLKHAPNVTRCSLIIEEIFKEAGFPEGVFQSLVIDVNEVPRILASPFVHGVALTGSENAGSQVGAIAGKNIKRAVLELGGSDPFIVLDDADLDKTVPVAIQSRMQNAGQSCIAAKRFIVMKSVKNDFVARFEQGIRALRQGNPFDADVTTGPMARLDLAEKIEQQVNASVKAGAQLLTGGSRSGCNYIPALLEGVTPGMPAFDEEMFGPVASVIEVSSEEDAIIMANNSRYGLGASVWTRDLDKGEMFAREIESGSVFVNSLMRSDARLPFGGIKKSGYGRELAEAGIKEFVNVKTVLVNH